MNIEFRPKDNFFALFKDGEQVLKDKVEEALVEAGGDSEILRSFAKAYARYLTAPEEDRIMALFDFLLDPMESQKGE